MSSSSWENSNEWYDRIVGPKGHYFHENVILPATLRLLNLSPSSALLDLACGQGILARSLPKNIKYTGVDLSPSLIRAAKKYNPPKEQQFLVGDVTQNLPLPATFTHASIILALQNIEDPLAVLKNARKHLVKHGKLLIVLNHPCFRIPRQSSWGLDAPKKLQYRRVDRYFSALKIPIQTHPSEGKESVQTFSFHTPISTYTQYLKEAGFVIEVIEEWCSDKKSSGSAASYENRSRKEFPLFLTLLAQAFN
jgi:ubiquinone/menaquinone biosynthesis C-methylase UbiE